MIQLIFKNDEEWQIKNYYRCRQQLIIEPEMKWKKKLVISALIDYCYKQTDSVGGVHSGNIGVRIYIEKVKATIAYSKYKKKLI